MKTIVEIDKEVGSDGLKAKGSVGVEGSSLAVQISLQYPIEKIVEPVTEKVDELLTKLEQAIPGDWDQPFIQNLKAEFKEKLVALLSE